MIERLQVNGLRDLAADANAIMTVRKRAQFGARRVRTALGWAERSKAHRLRRDPELMGFTMFSPLQETGNNQSRHFGKSKNSSILENLLGFL
jgi:hypothetical protein